MPGAYLASGSLLLSNPAIIGSNQTGHRFLTSGTLCVLHTATGVLHCPDQRRRHQALFSLVAPAGVLILRNERPLTVASSLNARCLATTAQRNQLYRMRGYRLQNPQ